MCVIVRVYSWCCFVDNCEYLLVLGHYISPRQLQCSTQIFTCAVYANILKNTTWAYGKWPYNTLINVYNILHCILISTDVIDSILQTCKSIHHKRLLAFNIQLSSTCQLSWHVCWLFLHIIVIICHWLCTQEYMVVKFGQIH